MNNWIRIRENNYINMQEVSVVEPYIFSNEYDITLHIIGDTGDMRINLSGGPADKVLEWLDRNSYA